MDILKPELLWIGKRCYRVNPVANDDSTIKQAPVTSEYVEDDLYSTEMDREEDGYDIVEIGKNRYKTEFHVPNAFYGMLIGAKGATRKRIEGETKTEIVIPKHGQKDDIKVFGTSRDAVTAARRRIDLVVSACRNKQRPTHFTCVKITNSSICENALKFKREILSGSFVRGLEEAMFHAPERLHITIGMLVLMDDVDRKLATQLLNECLERILLPAKAEFGKLNMNVRGVEIMNDDPSSASVLYGKIESEALQAIADRMVKFFIDQGLGKTDWVREHVKLHMTLINVKHMADDDADDKNQGKRPRLTFDARNILENYANYEFGAQEVDHIHLAMCNSKANDGFYSLTSSIKL